MDKNKKIYFPIIFLLSWLCFTILVFTYGPYKYEVSKPFIFYSYLLAVHLALAFGYIRGQKSYGRGSRLNFNYFEFVKLAVIISLFYLLVKVLFTFGGDLRHFSGTFSNASKSYLDRSVRKGNIFLYFDIFFTPVNIFAITNTLFCYKKLGKLYRYCTFLLIIFTIASSVGSATRSGIVQISMISLSAFLLGIYKKTIVLKYYHKILLFFFGFLLLIGFLSYSLLLTNSRGSKIVINPLTNEPPRKDFFLTRSTNHKYHDLINNVSFYVSHSYFRLNKAMNLPFKGIGLGLTNSYFVMDNIESLTGWSGLKEISYGVRLDKGIGTGYGQYWSTFYTWIGSDFTFPGTIIILYFIGYVFSLSLRDSLYSFNPLSVTVFCILFYDIFHFAFNNPLQDGAGISTSFIIPLIWLMSRKKHAEVYNS